MEVLVGGLQELILDIVENNVISCFHQSQGHVASFIGDALVILLSRPVLSPSATRATI